MIARGSKNHVVSSKSGEVWLGGEQPSVVGVAFLGVWCVSMLILAFALHRNNTGDSWMPLLFGFGGLIFVVVYLVKSTVSADRDQRLVTVEFRLFGTSFRKKAIPFEDIDKVLVIHSVSVEHDYRGKVGSDYSLVRGLGNLMSSWALRVH